MAKRKRERLPEECRVTRFPLQANQCVLISGYSNEVQAGVGNKRVARYRITITRDESEVSEMRCFPGLASQFWLFVL